VTQHSHQFLGVVCHPNKSSDGQLKSVVVAILDGTLDDYSPVP
jgi:hypothetical protein